MFVCVLALHIQLFYDLAYVVIKVVIMLPTSSFEKTQRNSFNFYNMCSSIKFSKLSQTS